MATMERLMPCWHFQNKVIFFILGLNVADILVAQFTELAVTPILSFLCDQNPDVREAGVHVLVILSTLGGISNFLTWLSPIITHIPVGKFQELIQLVLLEIIALLGENNADVCPAGADVLWKLSQQGRILIFLTTVLFTWL
jgi:hypothetical protein